MTLESTLPYLSLAAALGAAAAAGQGLGRTGTVLRCVAVAALAVFAYFRWIAPDEISLALTLHAAGQALTSLDRGRWRQWGAAFLGASWLVLAYLFLQAGEGRSAFLDDAVKAALLALLLACAGLAVRRVWRAPSDLRWPGLGAIAALTVMGASALSLGWGLWPAIAGTAGIVASEAVIAGQRTGRLWIAAAAWLTGYLGMAAVTYAFLR